MLKKLFYYQMHELQQKGKDIDLARKAVLLTISVMIILLGVNLVVLNMDRIVSDLSGSGLQQLGTPKLFGSLLGLVLVGVFYFVLRATIGRDAFFHAVKQEFTGMTPEQQKAEARSGMYLTIVPFATLMAIFFYHLFTRT